MVMVPSSLVQGQSARLDKRLLLLSSLHDMRTPLHLLVLRPSEQVCEYLQHDEYRDVLIPSKHKFVLYCTGQTRFTANFLVKIYSSKKETQK